ncbi:MAG: glycosyltransferase family 117 protein [Gemmatimonadales bacterium]
MIEVREPPPYRMALGVALGTLALYVLTLAPTTQFWDTSEYIAAAYVLGIPHPPGNPLFTIVAHVWGMLPLAAQYATRINLFAAATSAVAAACWFLVGERWLRPIVPHRWPRRLAALAGALVAATAFTVWNQSVVNEKVYTLSLLSIALVLWLIVRWDDQPPGEAHDHHLLLIIYLLALTATNHMMGVLVGPVAVVLLFPPLKAQRPPTADLAARRVEWSQWAVFTSVWLLLMSLGLEAPWRALMVTGEPGKAGILFFLAALYLAALAYAARAKNWGFALVMLGVALVGLSVFVYLPIRAAHFPAINEGEPTTWDALWSVLTREQYGKPPLHERNATFVAQVGMWWQYFSWQWGHDWAAAVQRGLAVIYCFIGLLGAWRHWQADRRAALALGSLVFSLTLFLIFILNFRYGFSQYPDRPQLEREVRERDYFYMGSFAVWGVWVGMGLATLMEWTQQWIGKSEPDERRRWLLATPVLALALIPLVGNRLTASRAGETLARDFAHDLLQSVEPYGVLVTAGDNDTFPLWYAQEVEGIRRDVTVLNLSLANTDWYVRQLQRRPVADFDSTGAPAIYRGRTWPKPTGPLLSFTPAQLDALQLYYVLPDTQTVTLGGIPVRLDPQLIGRQYLERADVVVLQAIRDQVGKRPVAFSRTVGLYADQFGLTAYLEGHGFARALRSRPLAASDSLQIVSSLGYVNVDRTRALLFDVYHAGAAARQRPRGWVDQPSEGIVNLYGLLYQSMAEVLRERSPDLATRALLVADSVFRNTSIRFQPPPERP